MTFIQTPEEPWSDAEEWAWQEIRAGRVADFNASEGREKPLDPTKSKGWRKKRKLRSKFLKQILFRQPYRSEIPVEGVRIVGAWFPEGVELEYCRLSHQLWLENCRFERPVELLGLQIDGWFSLRGSAVDEQSTDTLSLSLDRAKIAGGVNLDSVTFGGKLDMTGLEVGKDLWMGEGAMFKDVFLTAAKVGGQYNLSSAKVDGKLNMNSLNVGQHLLMGEGATFKDVELIGAKVGTQLNLDKATVDGKLNMNGLDVGQSLLMREGATFKDMKLTGAKVGGQLNLDKATF
jgi:hypothetical protein